MAQLAEPAVIGFADESTYDNAAVCAVALFPAERIHAAEAKLAEVKAAIGVSVETAFHCRTLFGQDARRKSGWAKVDPPEIYDAIGTLCADLKSIAYQPTVIFARRNEVPEHLTHPSSRMRPPYAASPQNWARLATPDRLEDGFI